MPWAVSWSLGDDKLIFRPKHNIYTFFIILFDLLLLFVCQICHVKQKIEKKNQPNKSKAKVNYGALINWNFAAARQNDSRMAFANLKKCL